LYFYRAFGGHGTFVSTGVAWVAKRHYLQIGHPLQRGFLFFAAGFGQLQDQCVVFVMNYSNQT